MIVVHSVYFANTKDAMDFARTLWEMERLVDLGTKSEVIFETCCVEITGHIDDVQELLGTPLHLDSEPMREC